MRRAVAILVGALTVLVGAVWSSTAVGSSTDGRGNFLDDDGSVHESAINGMAASDITRGCNPPDNTRYCPNEPVSRAQMATFLVRALGLPATDESGFRDTSGSVHAEAIDALASAGITRGCNPPANDRFCPADSVTRAQMASFLVRALDLRSAEAHGFTDTENSVHRQSIDALAAADITRGCNPPDNTRFCPDHPVTRSQMATFLVRALEGVDPIVNRLSMRSGLRCSKDGLSCTGRVTLAAGVQLQVTEGWYQVLPYRAEEEDAFKAGSTEVSFAWNGSPLEREYLGTSEGSSPATRTWRTNPPTLTSGTHTLRAAWRWAGDVTQSVSYTITVP